MCVCKYALLTVFTVRPGATALNFRWRKSSESKLPLSTITVRATLCGLRSSLAWLRRWASGVSSTVTGKGCFHSHQCPPWSCTCSRRHITNQVHLTTHLKLIWLGDMFEIDTYEGVGAEDHVGGVFTLPSVAVKNQVRVWWRGAIVRACVTGRGCLVFSLCLLLLADASHKQSSTLIDHPSTCTQIRLGKSMNRCTYFR